MDVDALLIANENRETACPADIIEGIARRILEFKDLHGFSIDGVDIRTSTVPEGWRESWVKVQGVNTAVPGGHPIFTGW